VKRHQAIGEQLMTPPDGGGQWWGAEVQVRRAVIEPGAVVEAISEAETECDAEVISRSRDDPNAFEVLYDRYAADIHRYVARRLGAETADDLMAETFVVAFAGRRRYDGSRSNARPWLYGIATNLVAGHRRAEARRLKALARAAAPESAPSGGGDQLAEGVAGRVSAAALRPALQAALAGLSARNRDVLLLMAWGGLDHEETGRALGLGAGAVRSRLHRSRQQLRKALGGVDPLGPGAVAE
jgi:RNA polymerase sigma-70 factor (ECF subfamily)